MTFYEAALEVLRRNERPLHFKKITEISIREQLLSHIGRDPARVMVERLQKDIERGEESALLEPRRGVFDLKAEVRNRLNKEAERQKELEESSSFLDARGYRRARFGGGHSLSTPVHFDPDALKNLSKTRFDTIEDAAYALLKLSNEQPVHVSQLADIIFNQKLIKFHTHDPETTLRAALATANQLAARRNKLPLFTNYSGDRWGLSEWGISDTSLRLRQDLERISSNIRSDTEKQLAKTLTTLKPEALEMVIMTLLDLLDYTNLKISKRTSSGDVLFTADWTRGFSSTRVCISVINNNDTVVDEQMIQELRSNLPHYNGEEAIIIHLGKVANNAINAMKSNEKGKVTLLNAQAIVSLLVKYGIGVQTFNQPIILLDRLFFETLG